MLACLCHIIALGVFSPLTVPLSLLTFTLFWISTLPHILYALQNTNLLSVPYVHTTFASRGFSVAAPTQVQVQFVLHVMLFWEKCPENGGNMFCIGGNEHVFLKIFVRLSMSHPAFATLPLLLLRHLLKTHCFQQTFAPLAANPSASDSACGWHCTL